MRQVKSDGAKNAFVQKYVENTQTSKGWPLKGWLHHFDVHMQTLKPDTYLRCVFLLFFFRSDCFTSSSRSNREGKFACKFYEIASILYAPCIFIFARCTFRFQFYLA